MKNVVFKTTHRRQAMLLWATLIVFLALALMGCGAEAEGSGDVPVTDPVDRQQVEFDGNNAEVGMVVVNGVTCIVVDGYRTNGITCDWEGAR